MNKQDWIKSTKYRGMSLIYFKKSKKPFTSSTSDKPYIVPGRRSPSLKPIVKGLVNTKNLFTKLGKLSAFTCGGGCVVNKSVVEY